MSTRKRKAKPKYHDEAPVKRAKSTTETPRKLASAPRAVKVKRNDPEWLVTNEKSPLADEDLHAEFCDPITYENYTREDWEDLRSTLPDNVPFNSDGYSIPIDFFKFDPDFRRGIREFQEDLSTGRLDPKWQAAAAEAMEERARGDFDSYKENNYEEFWGQKQKLDRSALAGESTTLKLEIMIEHGMFRVGDEFFFSRAIGRKEKRILIEKECKVVAIGDQKMTLAIPPGRLKYTSRIAEPDLRSDAKIEGDASIPTSEEPGDATPGIDKDGEGVSGDAARDGTEPALNGIPGGVASVEPEIDEATKATKREPDGKEEPTPNGIIGNTPGETVENEDDGPSTFVPRASEPEEVVILHEINNLKQLNDKIVEIDGRLNPKNTKEVPAISPWKIIRAKRNNQDLGTIFDMREYFFVYKRPQIVKTPKKRS